MNDLLLNFRNLVELPAREAQTGNSEVTLLLVDRGKSG